MKTFNGLCEQTGYEYCELLDLINVMKFSLLGASEVSDECSKLLTLQEIIIEKANKFGNTIEELSGLSCPETTSAA